MQKRITGRDWRPAARFARCFVGAPLRAALLVTAALVLVPLETLAQAPAAPANLRAESGGNGYIRVTWDDPNDSAITGYESRLRVGSESEWRRDWTAIEGAGAETTRLTITNIAPGVTILWALRARNANGPGPSSSVTVTARKRPAGHITASSTSVEPGGTVSLTATAHDPDGGPVTYLWEAGAGSFDATDRASVTWTAPSGAGRWPVWFTVTDDEGETGTATVHITVGGGGIGGGPGLPAAPAFTPETKARSTPVVGRRARAIDTHHCFVPESAELAALGESMYLRYRLDSGQDFDLCLWAPDPNWRNAPAYASCRGADGALPEVSSLLKGAGREEFSVERDLALMACVVPAGPDGESGDWTLRIAPGQYGLPEPETTGPAGWAAPPIPALKPDSAP